MNAAYVGIDKLHIALQVRFDWPRDLLTYFQERGRGSRQPGVRSTCVLYDDLSSYVFLLCQLVRGSEQTNITVESQLGGECDGFNSAISPRRLPVHPANTSHEDFALGPTAKKRLQDCCIKELHEVASNEQNNSMRFKVSILKKESLVVLVRVIPRNKVMWVAVSFAPHP